MEKLLLIPIVTMAAYLTYIKIRYGMTISISATAKLHQYWWEKAWFMFTLVVGVALPLIVYGLETSVNSDFQFLWFLAGAAIVFIGAAQVYWKGGMEYTVHMIGSYTGVILGIIACVLNLWSVTTVLLVAAFILFSVPAMFKWTKINNHIYWIEIATLVTVLAALFLG